MIPKELENSKKNEKSDINEEGKILCKFCDCYKPEHKLFIITSIKESPLNKIICLDCIKKEHLEDSSISSLVEFNRRMR